MTAPRNPPWRTRITETVIPMALVALTVGAFSLTLMHILLTG